MSKSEECIICKSKIKMLLYCNGCHRRKIDQAKQDGQVKDINDFLLHLDEFPKLFNKPTMKLLKFMFNEKLKELKRESGGGVIKTDEKELKSYIVSIRDRLRNFVEDRTMPMDVKVHEWLWQEIQSIDHDIETDYLMN